MGSESYRYVFVMAQSVASDFRSRGHKLESQLSHITFMETDQEIISRVIFPLRLIQEEQLSVTITDKSM